MFFDPIYFVFVGPAMLLALWAQLKVKSAFSRWSDVANLSGATGAEAAATMLRSAGLDGVGIEEHQGFLSDHYDPKDRMLRLSPDVYHGRTVAALGVACHEAGHAIQHAKSYAPLQMRTAIVPFANIGSWLAWPMIGIGMATSMMNLALVGVVLFLALVVFQAITLPVEFDASNRAKAQLAQLGLLHAPEEERGVKQVLDAAALTYVAATVTAVAQLLYFLFRLGVFSRSDE